MSEPTHDTFKEIQSIDRSMEEVRNRIASFDPLLAEVEEPVQELESEFEAVRNRLEEMRQDMRRLERGAEEKKTRAARLEERMTGVQNVREEAAVRTELDLVRRARETDEQEILGLMEQIQRSELREEELQASLDEARADVEPRRRELEGKRRKAEAELRALQEQRESILGEMTAEDRKMYESFRAGGRSVVVANLLPDGACGNCFNVVPLQTQNEIRKGETKIRCEACGVLLAPPEPEQEG